MSRPAFSPPGSPPHCSHHRAGIDNATVAVAHRGWAAVPLRPRHTVVVSLHAPVARNCVCGLMKLRCARKRAADAFTLKDGGGQ